MLGTVLLQAGHEVIFYPKFHCELNYIEYLLLGCSKTVYSRALQISMFRVREDRIEGYEYC